METSNNIPTIYKSEINIFQGASTLSISEDETKKLSADFSNELIEIRPDGMIFLPQVFWRERLNKVFGIGQWALIIKHNTQDVERNKLYVESVMMIRGCYISTAVGEAELHEDNKMQSWASVWESAKSDSITRCCKDLGIASQLWQPNFINKWKDDNAVQVWVDGKNRPQWRKKTAKAFFKEKGFVVDHNEQTPPSGGSGTSENPWLNKTTRDGKITAEWERVIKDISSGVVTLAFIKGKYKINAANLADLSAVKVEQSHPIIKGANTEFKESELPAISEISFKTAMKMAVEDGSIYSRTIAKYKLTKYQDEKLFDVCKSAKTA